MCEINAKRLREWYLQAVLRQDIAYFDTVGAGEVTTRVQTDTREYSPHFPSLDRGSSLFSFGSAGHFQKGRACG